ncbi:hypothetical protein [Streptomyces sp. NPDC005336]|uniref:hypothetical protein n=1 Tax=Streptomyces sp. NPDC005336 TaxID=3157035 RepID=UPI0033BA0BB9
MKDTAWIEEAVDRLVGGAVERQVDEGPSGETTVQMSRGARSVSMRETGEGWLVTLNCSSAESSTRGGKLIASLEEALELVARLLDPEGEQEEADKPEKQTLRRKHSATNGVALHVAALSSSAASRPDPLALNTVRPAAPPPRPRLPPVPGHSRGSRLL